MGLIYIKRFRMEIDLTRQLFPPPVLPPGYAARAWQESLLETHADTKFRCFRCELDVNVFPSLGNVDGCRRLMRDITSGEAFVREATWLIEYHPSGHGEPEYCGTIQGIRLRSGVGSVQNVGIVPEHRGRGLGTFLLYKSLAGFRDAAAITKVSLEVTAHNSGAIRLYRRLGFRKVRTVYKTAEVACA